jgi:ABC-type sugar transport system permease subunit
MSNGGGRPVDAGGRRAAGRGRPIVRLWRRPEAAAGVEDRSSLIGHSRATPYLLSGPSIIMVSVLLAFPVLYAMWSSLFDAEFLGGEQHFVGLQQYVDLFKDPDFRSSITRSLVFVTGCLLLGISLALVFAFALNKAAGFLRFLRGVTVVPYLVSGVATAVMFRLLFNQEFGQVNRALEFFGLDGPAWFSSPVLAMVATIVAQVWSDLPLAVLVLLGGLQTIEPSLLDAAEVDGASGWHRAWYVSMPLIAPQIALATVWFSYSTLTSLGVVLALTGGGPVNATRILPVALYETAFLDLRTHEALAIAIVILALNALLTLVYVGISRRYDLGN